MRSPFSGLPRPWRVALDWVGTLVLAALFVLAFEVEVAKPFRIPSSSMEPTLHCARPALGCRASFSDRVVALRVVYRFRDPRRGEVAVFNAPARAATACQAEGGTFVKRVIGLPGERVSERFGQVYVNGRPLSERYVIAGERDRLTLSWPRLRPGQYFVMGDNRADSCDSRQWGPVPRGSFIGPVVLTYWPLGRAAVH